MNIINKTLGKAFKVPLCRQADLYRKSRPDAKKLAVEHGIEIELLRPGFNVWPPRTLADDADEFGGDHYVHDWNEVYERVKTYVAATAPVSEQA